MKRRGIEAITTFQQHPSKLKAQFEYIENADLLTTGLDWQRNHSGFEGDIHILSDPVLTATATPESIAGDIKVPSLTQKHLPTEVVTKELPSTEADMETMMLETVRNMVGKKIADLILLPFEKIRMDQTLDDFGMDSMLAAEFRTYISRALEVDIPFRMLLDKNTTVDSLSEVVCASLKRKEVA